MKRYMNVEHQGRGIIAKIFVLLSVLALAIFVKPASSAVVYPDLAVVQIYFGDSSGDEIAPVAGRKVFLWAVIVNVGDGPALDFYVDIYLEDQVTRLGPYFFLGGTNEEPVQGGGKMRIHLPQELLIEARAYEVKVDVNPDRAWVGSGSLIEKTYGNNVLTKTINVTQTGVSCAIDQEKAQVNQPITIKGATDPPTPNVDITLLYSIEDTPWMELATVKASEDGAYAYTWTPDTPETFLVRAIWPKGPDHPEEVESLARTLTVQTQTILSCTTSLEKVELGDFVTVTGTLSPSLSGFPIILVYERPSGTTLERATYTLSTGTYKDDYTPTITGTWSVHATWRGNANYLESISQIVSFTVEKKVQPTPTPTSTLPPTPTPSPSPTIIPTTSPTPTPIPTHSPSPTPTPTITSTPISTPTSTPSPKSTPSLTPTPTLTPTSTPKPSWYERYETWIAAIVVAIVAVVTYLYIRRR